MLTALIVIPLLAAGAIALMPATMRLGVRMVSLLATGLTLALALLLLCQFGSAPATDGYRFSSSVSWVSVSQVGLEINYHVGVDGINLGLLVMAAIVAFAAVCVSWEIQRREKEFYLLLMLMTGGILGAFASLDLFCLYFFHELALVPTFIMIGVWGRGERRNYATFQITIYLSLGALLALIGLILLYLEAGARSFDLVQLSQHLRDHPIDLASQQRVFPLLLFGFGILVSLWPFHSWAPLGYASAPTATAMLHAGVLKKFGLYALIRIALPLLPDAAHQWLPVLALLALGNLLYCGLVALRQTDLNLLFGFSSVAHMGFAFLGIATQSPVGIAGAIMVMVAHGLLAALSFGLAGALHQRTQTLQLADLGGLARRLPFLATAMTMAMFAGCGLPGFGNFVGEVMVFFGAWTTLPTVTVVAVWSALIIGAVYLLRALRKGFHGTLPDRWSGLADIAGWARLPFVLLLVGLLTLGVYPRLLLDPINASLSRVLPPGSGAVLVEPISPGHQTPTLSTSAVNRLASASLSASMARH